MCACACVLCVHLLVLLSAMHAGRVYSHIYHCQQYYVVPSFVPKPLPNPIQVWSPLMCSLLDQVLEGKEIQLGRVQPYTAGPADLLVQDPVEEVSCTLTSSVHFRI